MRALPFLVIACITMSALAPAAAQQFSGNYPICLQRWEWGGSTTIWCQYSSWEECKATAAGLPAMCLVNPYAPGPSRPDRAPRQR
ncbi:DUF3551 domain-containing protein [Bradyrhizobium hipponense]|uniref:DUF3551 domain-containing protein n=1 Tax=Bradyrhizobium hipponense TaxID=2605638 RepID=A0A5S4YRF5_9BRAD|nr:DUF3551 domain-containing protein [Bradyrhizobium hipponense]TYO66718.1 DUF3551 domain-containing protein [Bradyrhizobium hipponense]